MSKLDVPGLHLISDFFDSDEQSWILNAAMAIYGQLSHQDRMDCSSNTANIPQPDFIKSEAHNLASEEKYVRVSLDAGERVLKGEYFPRYGEDGHALLYLRGNENLPDFVAGILPRIRDFIGQHGLVGKDIKDSWRLTMNFYQEADGVVAGFPFHVDIPANGVVTMILNIHREATFQITKGDVIHDIQLPVGALLILSGESRYKWKHRVLPSQVSESTVAGVERVSLVLGVR